MTMDQDDMPQTAVVQFNCAGAAVGKMRNELAVEMVKPFHESFQLATDEGAFHGGDATAPPPLALFVAGLTGCLMTQIRAFAKRLDVPLDDLKVEARIQWDWEKAGRVYETAPRSMEIDVLIDSSAPFEDAVELIRIAQKGCFIEQTLARENTIRHRIMRDGEYVEI